MSNTANKIVSYTLLGVLIWILISIYISQFNIFNENSTYYYRYTSNIAQYIPDISSISPNKYDDGNIPSSLKTIPSLFIISVSKTGSSSLIKWLINTKQIYGDRDLSEGRVENNVIWKHYVDKVIIRNDSIGFYLSDQQIINYDDFEFIYSFTKKNKRQKEISSDKFLKYQRSKNRINRQRPKRIQIKQNRKLLKKRNRFYDKKWYKDKKIEKHNYYTVGKSVFYFHLPFMARIFAIKYPNTKILITIRNPIFRLKSNYLFFIGDEINKLPKLYGNVNLYLNHIINNKLLKEPFEEIKKRLTVINTQYDKGMDINITEWHEIFRSYKVFLVNMIKVCKEEFILMGYIGIKIKESCKERDLIRSAFGISCYIVPIMYWFMINLNPNRNFKILQSQLMFEKPDEHITRILCWVQMDRNDGNCNGWKDKKWQNKDIWRRSNKQKITEDINDKLKIKIKEELMQCNIGLTHFIKQNPFVQLYPFDLTLWN